MIWGSQLRIGWKRFRQDHRGQDLLEYALCAGMVAVAAVAAMPALSSTVNNIFVKVASVVAAAWP